MIENISILAAVFAVVVVLTNIITEVVKSATYGKVPTRVVALAVAVLLSVTAVVVYCTVMNIAIVWYCIVGAIVIGFVAAYVAMFGYDNLYTELAEAVKKMMGGTKL